jgi:hypothetical protein
MKSRVRHPANAASRTECLWRDDRGVSGKVGEQLRLKAEYLVAENRILRSCTITFRGDLQVSISKLDFCRF